MGNVEDQESDKHVRQTKTSQKVFPLVLPQGDTSAMNDSRDCVGCHYLCIHHHISSESLLLTCLVISWLQRWKGDCGSDGRQWRHQCVFWVSNIFFFFGFPQSIFFPTKLLLLVWFATAGKVGLSWLTPKCALRCSRVHGPIDKRTRRLLSNFFFMASLCRNPCNSKSKCFFFLNLYKMV